MYGDPDTVYPNLVKKVLPLWLTGFFVAVIVGAVLSTFNSALNSAATIFSLDIYKKYFRKDVSDKGIVRIGRLVSLTEERQSINFMPLQTAIPIDVRPLSPR